MMIVQISTQTLMAINAERGKQTEKFGHDPLASPTEACAIIGEEFGEVCRAVCQNLHPLERRKEIIQLAAVCVAWLDGDLHFGPSK